MINNAGILRTGRFEDIDLSAHFTEIDINTKGVVNGLHAAFPYLRATPNPVVVNLVSASAIYGQAELADYSATKFFVRGITEALDIEWNSYGIRVIAIWPLYVKTAMTKNIKTGTTESLGIKLTAQDVADAIVSRSKKSSKAVAAISQASVPITSGTTARARAQSVGSADRRTLLNNVSGSPLSDTIIKMPMRVARATDDTRSIHSGWPSGRRTKNTSTPTMAANEIHHHRHSRGASSSARAMARFNRPTTASTAASKPTSPMSHPATCSWPVAWSTANTKSSL